jgi:UDP-3-O-[3-hydroxymyristoyl] glucosamine N-acyltransferase
MTLTELAKALNIPHKGAGNAAIKGVRDIERLSPDQPLEDGYVYFIESPAVHKRHPLAGSNGIILTTAKLADKFQNALISPDADARLFFIAMLKLFEKRPAAKPGVDAHAHVHPTAKVAATAAVMAGAVVMEGATIGENCVIYPNAVIEPHAIVGDGTFLAPNVVIGHHCVIGKHCIIHGGTVIGADGFGFYDHATGRHKIPHVGNVVVEDFVEMGSGCTVDRATIETTLIRAQTKLDDQVHVGHNCDIGRYVYIVGNSAIGGSVVLEDGCMISGNAIVKDHLRLATGTIIMGASAVAQDTEPKTAYFGVPARPARQMHRMNAALERLPDLLTRVKDLETKLGIETPTPV